MRRVVFPTKLNLSLWKNITILYSSDDNFQPSGVGGASAPLAIRMSSAITIMPLSGSYNARDPPSLQSGLLLFGTCSIKPSAVAWSPASTDSLTNKSRRTIHLLVTGAHQCKRQRINLLPGNAAAIRLIVSSCDTRTLWTLRRIGRRATPLAGNQDCTRVQFATTR